MKFKKNGISFSVFYLSCFNIGVCLELDRPQNMDQFL